MPILDIEIVQTDGAPPPDAALTQALAAAAGRALATQPGRTWVRLRTLPAAQYAENEYALAPDELPVFASLLHAHPPEGTALADEVAALTQALAACIGRDARHVHVQYTPAAAGRQAFGGVLVI